MKAALKDEASLQQFASGALAQLGKEVSVENERVMPGPHFTVYTKLVHYSALPMPGVVTFAFSDNGEVSGFSIRPLPNPAESKYLDYHDKNAYRFPLRGAWLVYQGGRSTYDNYHAAAPDERFAFDIVRTQSGKLFSGPGEKIEDYYGYGQPVVAPADGTVVAAADKYEDNPLMKPSPSAPKEGNTVVIDHGNGEFSMLAHLKHASVKVKPGDKVKAGQELALVGNSGNSPFPHLHYHLQTTTEWFHGEGLPIQFTSVRVDGKEVKAAEPVRGQVVEQP
jgi:murein DD-endopeptidase MepM/ murein hydrolase activator NlpD